MYLLRSKTLGYLNCFNFHTHTHTQLHTHNYTHTHTPLKVTQLHSHTLTVNNDYAEIFPNSKSQNTISFT